MGRLIASVAPFVIFITDLLLGHVAPQPWGTLLLISGFFVLGGRRYDLGKPMVVLGLPRCGPRRETRDGIEMAPRRLGAYWRWRSR
jgi:hypothetical protein